MSKPTAVTLFSGGGGTALGLRAAGYEVVGAVEYDEAIASVYDANMTGHRCTVGKVEEVDPRPWIGVDLIQASTVCTRASLANANRGESEVDLAAADGTCNFIRVCRPKAFLMENVAGYAGFESFRRIVACLHGLGYRFDWQTLDAADFGVPQNRVRLILRAVRGGSVPDVHRTHGPQCRAALYGGLFDDVEALPVWRGWYGAVADLLPGCPDSELAGWQRKRLPAELMETMLITNAGNQPNGHPDRGPVQVPVMSACPTVTAQFGGRVRAFLVGDQSAAAGSGVAVRDGDAPAPAILTRANGGCQPKAFLVSQQDRGAEAMLKSAETPMPTLTANRSPGEYRAVLIEGDAAGDRPPTCGTSEEPAFTLKTSSGGRVHRSLEHGVVKAMTLRCLARFQSFPDSYRLPMKPDGTENKKLGGLIIGNAWPPLMAQRVGEAMRDCL